MDKTRRIAALCLALSLVCLLLAACGQPAGNSSSSVPPPASTETSEPAASESESASLPEEAPEREAAQQLLAPLYDLFAADDIDAVMELIARPEYHALGNLLDGPEDKLTYTAGAEAGAETKHLGVYSLKESADSVENIPFYYFGYFENGIRSGESYWVYHALSDQESETKYVGKMMFENDLPNGACTEQWKTQSESGQQSSISTSQYVDALTDGIVRSEDIIDAGTPGVTLFKYSMGKWIPYDDPPQYTEDGDIILGRDENNPSLPAYIPGYKTLVDLDEIPLAYAPGFEPQE